MAAPRTNAEILVIRAFVVKVNHRQNRKSGVKAFSVQASSFAVFKINILIMGTAF
jgi:hypothetical protein